MGSRSSTDRHDVPVKEKRASAAFSSLVFVVKVALVVDVDAGYDWDWTEERPGGE